ncbi:MAG: flagellar FlbD family protein [Catonella sp.]|jgi:flagellar protein FlbD|nr:flagellar FlbD family protein [Catonella sp.]MDY6356175.1 flagellar FlbD family protein [Catonella sp.]
MIDVTRMNGLPITINADLIESVDEVPDTVIILTTGKRIMVKETREEIKDLVMKYKHSIATGAFFNEDS